MTWRSQWSAISGRISGLHEAGSVLLTTLLINSSDAYGTSNRLSYQVRLVLDELASYLEAYRATLPIAAIDELKAFLDEEAPRIKEVTTGLNAVQIGLPSLIWLRAAVDYHLRDAEVVAVILTERAFTHLQSLLDADPRVRTAWESAFAAGEVACERLGATHLLQHGVWSFKAHAAGGRTDLVLGEPLSDPSRVESAAEALVLTEWKVARERAEASVIVEKARAQARLYAGGILSGIELASYRYVVLVSRDRIAPIADEVSDGIRYRTINIAVTPSTPSRAT